MRKAVVAEGGLDRDSTYFGGSTKKETCLTMPFISFENDLAQRILESECSYIYLVEFYCKCCILIGYTLVALVAIYQLLLYTQALDMSYSAIWLHGSLLLGYLTIRQCTRVVYEQIVNEAQPSWLSLIDNEGKLSNCFSINLLVRQNVIWKKFVKLIKKPL
jgi:hypothetical protein